MALATYTVKSGDNLTKICDGRCGANVRDSIAGSTVAAKIQTLVKLNNLPNPNLIVVGQVLKLTNGASSSSSSTTTSATPAKPTLTSGATLTQAGLLKNVVMGLDPQTDDGRGMCAYWDKFAGTSKYNVKHLQGYEVRWEWYVNGHLEWETETIEVPYCYSKSIPKEAVYCQLFIKPVAVNKKDADGNDTDTPEWTVASADETRLQYQFSENPPSVPPQPNIEIDNENLTLTASIDGIDAKELGATSIIFNVIQDNSASIANSSSIRIDKDPVLISKYVAYTFNGLVKPGHTYKVRAKTISAKNKESGWSEFSDLVGTKPSAPTMLSDKCARVKKPDGRLAVRLEWTAVSNAETYKIEYVTYEPDFENTPDSIQSTTTDTARTSIELDISETGSNYYFRVRAVNEHGESDPSSVVMIPIGLPPEAPTTWSTADSVFVGDVMELHWLHSANDNSKQTKAQLSLNINDAGWKTVYTLDNTTDADTTGTRMDQTAYEYGIAVSYKGELYFKMDTGMPIFNNAKIQWKVRTAGVTGEFGEEGWSVERTIYIYEKPFLNLSMTSDLAGTGPLINTLTTFPFYVRAKDSLTSYERQRPTGYHLQIVSKDYYVTIDEVGRTKTVNVGDVVYSKYFSTDEELIVEMSADNIDLQSPMTYTLSCFEDMSTGLVIENHHEFTVNWQDLEYPISANIEIDPDSYTALITPYCAEYVPDGPGGKNLLRYPYTRSTITVDGIEFTDNGDGSITINGTATNRSIFMLHDVSGNYTGIYTVSGGISDRIKVSCEAYTQDNVWVKNATAGSNYSRNIIVDNNKLKVFIDITGGTVVNNVTIYPQLEVGYKATDYEQYYEKYVIGELIDGLTLSVYRREYDGTYTEIASGIPNNYTSITDPHPALDYARYRFVAKDTATGAISFYDMPGYPVNAKTIILQWDEEWSTFDMGTDQSVDGPSWSGSLLKLPYNIRVTDSRKPQVELIEYAGRRNPVSYYGTQVNETSQWSADIPKDDKETIYALRRLSLWTGNVYVREPSGTGYWANVEVSFNMAYNDMVIPVSLNITRVEGGV